jgi:hypothetical protein
MRKSSGAGNPQIVYRSLWSNFHTVKRKTRPHTTQKKINKINKDR